MFRTLFNMNFERFRHESELIDFSMYLLHHLFPPRFVVPIPSALYHPAKNRVGISLISPQICHGVILLKNGVISVKPG